MTFFTEAMHDGTIDKTLKGKMSEQEFEMMIRGMVEDSVAWERHKMRHKDALIVPIANEEEFSDFEKKVGKKSGGPTKETESEIIQYDMHSKKFQAGCQCGQKFEIDVKNDMVQTVDPNLKMKELSNYDRKQSEEGSRNYGGDKEPAPSYNTQQPRHSSSYNSQKQGLKYKD